MMMASVRKLQLSPTFRVRLPGELERVTGGDVRVGGGDGEDEASVPANVSHDHVLDLVPDVGRLVSNSNLGKAGQVDECYVQY